MSHIHFGLDDYYPFQLLDNVSCQIEEGNIKHVQRTIESLSIVIEKMKKYIENNQPMLS